MKLIIFITLFVANAYAGNYRAVGTDSKTSWMSISDCEKAEKDRANYKGCFDVLNKVPDNYDTQTSEVDDKTKPVMKAKYNTVACDDPASCLNVTNDCTSGDWRVSEKNTLMPGWKSHCIGIDSYEKKSIHALVLNQTKKDAYDTDKAAKDAEQAAYAAVMKHMKFGERMVAMISLRNSAKGLSKGQVKQVVQDYSLINDLLRAGALDTAKDEITALTPDGTRIVQADKDAILAEINAYLGQ